MPYDDDDLFGDDFDFVDDDDFDTVDRDDSDVEEDEDSEVEKKKPTKKTVKKKTPARGAKSAAKPTKKVPARGVKKKAVRKPKPADDLFDEEEAEGAAPVAARPADEPIEVAPPEPPRQRDEAVVSRSPKREDEFEQPAIDDSEAPVEEPIPAGEAADHVVHIYEHGVLKRSLARKFTDEEAVSFAEEYSRTGKSYGRRAVAMGEDETPPQMFANAARG